MEGFPTEASLSRVSPNNPVLLTHASGHASFANALAMKLSGVTRTTKNPEGGEILKDAKGNPTGLLRETAAGLIRRGTGEPAPTDEERVARARRVLELAAQEVLSKGITSFQDAGTSFETIDRMKAMVDEGKLGVRLWVMVRAGLEVEAQKLAQYRMIDYGNGHLTVRAIKRSIDGALGSRGAWLLEPYTDKPESAGLNTTPVDEHSRRPPSWRCSTAISSACTPSAIAPTARRSTSSRRRSRPIPKRRTSAGASSMRSTFIRQTFRASAPSA